MPRINKKARPFVELLYWFVVFFLLGFMTTFHNRRFVDYEHMTMGVRITTILSTAIFGAIFTWLLTLGLKEITAKLFEE
ncbi:MAG: hypothetical protein JSS82_11125 [Bacteroidetes bacterium]|nr:hypothetical protein [Bacteroidota bacterium]